MIRRPPRSTLFSLHDALPISAGEHTTRAVVLERAAHEVHTVGEQRRGERVPGNTDRKSTRLNSSHVEISYAVFCLKKKKKKQIKNIELRKSSSHKIQ